MSKDRDYVVHIGADGIMAQSVNYRNGVIITASSDSKKVKPPLVDNSETGETDGWQNWGIDNQWPKQVREKIESSTLAAPLIYKAVCAMFGKGVKYYFEKKVGGKVEYIFEENEDVEEFFRMNSVDYIALQRMMDFKYFNNIFQEFIFNGKGDKVLNTFHLQAEYCRLSVQDEKTHRHEYIGFTGDWDNSDAKSVTKIKLVRFPEDSIEYILNNKKKGKVATHSCFPSPGRSLYAVPPHMSLYRKDGWLAFSNKIPQILNAFVDNAMSIKYHIQVPADYWATAFPKWESLSLEKQKELKMEKMEEWNEFLKGAKNVKKSFMSEYMIDKHTKKPLPGWNIEVIKDEDNFDKEIISSQESDAHIARALNIDPSLAGLQPQGGKMGAGSGSDKRVAFLNGISMSHAEELIILDFLYLIARINGWPKNIKFKFLHEIPTTLDKESSGVKEI